MDIELSDLIEHNIAYQIRRSQKAKRISLRITKAGLEIVLPKRWSYAHLKGFIQLELDWIKRHLQKQANLLQQGQENPFAWPEIYQEGIELVLAGEKKKVIIKKVDMKKKVAWHFDDVQNHFELHLKENGSILDLQNQIQNNLVEWYYDRALNVAQLFLQHWAPKMNAPLKGLKIKQQKRLWGSCSSQGNINLNWMLVLMPLPVFEYIVIHELSHLFHPNHSEAFWSKVEQYCPGYKVQEKWLRQHSGLISPPPLNGS